MQAYGVELAVASGGVVTAAGVGTVALCCVGVVFPVGGVARWRGSGVALDGTVVGGTRGGGVGVGAWKVDGDIVAACLVLLNQS